MNEYDSMTLSFNDLYIGVGGESGETYIFKRWEYWIIIYIKDWLSFLMQEFIILMFLREFII